MKLVPKLLTADNIVMALMLSLFSTLVLVIVMLMRAYGAEEVSSEAYEGLIELRTDPTYAEAIKTAMADNVVTRDEFADILAIRKKILIIEDEKKKAEVKESLIKSMNEDSADAKDT